VFVIGIVSESPAAAAAKVKCDEYLRAAIAELNALLASLRNADFGIGLRLVLLYVPMASKSDLTEDFDRRLKGLQ
jgi:hypothetical protein